MRSKRIWKYYVLLESEILPKYDAKISSGPEGEDERPAYCKELARQISRAAQNAVPETNLAFGYGLVELAKAALTVSTSEEADAFRAQIVTLINEVKSLVESAVASEQA